jgi:hypothetical protein
VSPGQEVIQVPEAAFGGAAAAADALDASLDHLAGTDWASLGTAAHGEMLARLQRAQGGYEPDGHRSARAWLVNKTGISKGAAGGAVGWQKRLTRHGRIATVMAAGDISESWAREIAAWTDRLPEDKRDEADQILLDAAASGLPLEDLAILAQTIHETWKARHPDPDDGNGETGDEDGFGDRYLRLGTTLDGVGKLSGDLTAGCAAALQAIFDALGKHLGPDDHRSIEQRQHDALIAPVVVGSVDWQALDAMAEEWTAVYGLDGHRRPCGCTCGGCTCRPPAPMTPEAKARLRAALLALAADAMSGPDGLAAYLRSRQLGVPYNGKPLPLDVGKVKGIPDHLRRAVILRDRHCAWPGGCDKPPAGCQVHHIVYRSRGGRTRLRDLVLLCSYHHQVCIHRLGWTLTLHPDGTTEARSPHGQILRSHGPPTTRAG